MKLTTLQKFIPLRRELRESGKKLVFTNGCFDIIHRGHVEYLAKAASFGDVLVVGMNSDESIRRIKGDGRPINPEDDRAAVLSALEFVDFIIPFEEDTPRNLIENLLPDVLAKGADWAEEDIVGADIVKESGGEVRRIELTPGRSTSAIIERILTLLGGDKDGS